MVYVTGDMHGDESRLYDKEWRKLKAGDILIILGDFGFLWNDTEREKSAIKYLSTRKFTVCFLDGTHENFDLIKKGRTTYWKGGKVHRIGDHLYHLMRGQIFTIDGIKFFTFGGGESDDKDVKSDHDFWWRSELPGPNEMALGATRLDEEDCAVDYILTHEPPSRVKSAMLLRKGAEDHVNKLNGFFEEVASTCTFRHWYFGSLHEDRQITSKYTCVFNKLIKIDMSKKVIYKKLNEVSNTSDITENISVNEVELSTESTKGFIDPHESDFILPIETVKFTAENLTENNLKPKEQNPKEQNEDFDEHFKENLNDDLNVKFGKAEKEPKV